MVLQLGGCGRVSDCRNILRVGALLSGVPPLFAFRTPQPGRQPGALRSAGVEAEETADRLGAGDPDPLITDEIGCVEDELMLTMRLTVLDDDDRLFVIESVDR